MGLSTNPLIVCLGKHHTHRSLHSHTNHGSVSDSCNDYNERKVDKDLRQRGFKLCKQCFENKGMIFSGLSPDQKLPEIIELKGHPWFIGVQFHPEFKSRPLSPHPLFSSFIKAAKIKSKK